MRALVVTKGHPFAREPFFAVFDDAPGIEWTHVEQPAAEALLHPERAARWDVLVFYDMPGIRFTGSEPPVELVEPPATLVRDFEALLDAGKGMVFLHHAVAGWPAWPRYAEVVGARFHYRPATLAGVDYPDSGYRFDVTHTVDVLDPSHPICDGLGTSFTLTDELYCFPVLADEVVPLMRTRFDTSDSSAFYSADLGIRGRRNANDGWSHPPGSDLVAWVKCAGRSPVAYLQFGDGPETYANASFRRALVNAIRWAASDDAHAWAAERPRSADDQRGH